MESLILILWALFLWEGLHWIRADTAVFRVRGARGTLGACWKISERSRGSVVSGGAFAPLPAVILCSGWTLALGRDGVSPDLPALWRRSTRRPPARFVPYEVISASPAGDDGRLRLANALVVDAGSASEAERIAALLVRLRDAPAARRTNLIQEEVRHRDAPAPIHARLCAWREAAAPAAWAGNALWAYLVFATIAVFSDRWVLFGWPLLLGTGLVLHATVLVLTARAHRRLYPTKKWDRVSSLLAMLFYPPSSLRAGELLARDLLLDRSPLGTARELLPQEEYRAVAARFLRNIVHPGRGREAEEDPDARRAVEEFLGILRETTEALLREDGLDPAELLRPPPAIPSECVSYCPGCLAQFVTARRECADCGEPLVSPRA